MGKSQRSKTTKRNQNYIKESSTNKDAPAINSSPTTLIDDKATIPKYSLNKYQVAELIEKNVDNSGEELKVNDSEKKRYESKIHLICKCLKSTSTIEEDLLNIFTLFLANEEDTLYNLGYFIEKIPNFKKAFPSVQTRLDNIINCYLSILSDPQIDIRNFIFRFDELYDFSLIDGSIDVTIKMTNTHNFTFFHGQKCMIRIISKNDYNTIGIREYDFSGIEHLEEFIELIQLSKTI